MVKKTSLFALCCIIFMMAIVMHPPVSAMELNPFADEKIYEKTPTEDMSDFIKADFNSDYGVIRLSKTFFWFETDKIAEYSLISNTDECLIECTASGKATLYSDGVLFEDAIFKDKFGELLQNINYKYFIEVSENFDVDLPEYKEVCIDDKNGTACHNEQIGSTKETRSKKVWQEYRGEILRAGDYVWKVEGNKRAMQTIDFIPVNKKEFSEWAWWNSTWERKKPINITERSGIAQTDFAIRLNITYDADMNATFSDLRFANGSESGELDYWIENYTASSSALVWVEVSTLSASANNTIYMYYKNPTAPSKSNADNTFLFYDDFTDPSNALNSTKWAVTTNGAVSGGTVCNSGGGQALWRTVNQWSGNLSMIARMKDGVSGNGWMGFAFHSSSSSQSIDITGVNSYSANGNENSLKLDATASAYSYLSGYKRVKMNKWGNNGTLYGSTSGWADDTHQISSVKASLTDTGYIKSENGANSGNCIDYVYLMKYTYPYPAYSVLDEQLPNTLASVLISPVNYFNTTNPAIQFFCNASDDVGIKNVTLLLDGLRNETVAGGDVQGIAVNFNKTLAQGTHNWTCETCDAEICVNATTGIRYLTVDLSVPQLSINTPLSTNVSLRANDFRLNFSFFDDLNNGDTCWYNLNNGTNITVAGCGGLGNSTIATTFNVSSNARHYLYVYGNHSLGGINSTSTTLYVFNYSRGATGSTAGEGSSVTFNFTLDGKDINSEYAGNNATFVFNSVSYVPDVISRTSQNYTYFEKTLVIPTGSGNSSGKPVIYNWTFDVRNATASLFTGATSSGTLTVYNVSLSDCAITTGKVILNMSLKDEETNTFVNITSPNTANIEIDMNVTSRTNTTQTWNFHKQWLNNNSVSICIPNELLNTTSYRIDFVVGYDATDKVREFFYMENGTLNNTAYFNSYTSNKIDLMDLATADSTTFLFEYTDADNQEVEDIIVHTFRKYIGEGIFREVERSKQDNSGQTHVHLVEEDVIYYFMITQFGTILFTSDTYNAKCLSTPCEISLSASATETNWSIIDNEGGQYIVTTDKATRTATVTFELSESALVNATLYKLYYGNTTLINASSLTATAGSIDLNVPLTYDNSTFFVVIYNDNVFVKSVWIDLTENANDYFGVFGAILGGLIVLALMLMAVSEGAGFIIFTILALIVITAMKLVDLGWLALISIIVAGAIIVWKLVNRRNTRQ